MSLPEDYYHERYKELEIVGVHGNAPHISRCLEIYRREGRFRDLDISPIVQNEATDHSLFNACFLNLYEPEVFTFQIGQNVGQTELLYTSLVCTGIGRSTLDVVVNFANVVSFTSMKLTNGFRLSVHDQDPFKLLYDAALKNILDPKFLLAVSLRRHQKNYAK